MRKHDQYTFKNTYVYIYIVSHTVLHGKAMEWNTNAHIVYAPCQAVEIVHRSTIYSIRFMFYALQHNKQLSMTVNKIILVLHTGYNILE